MNSIPDHRSFLMLDERPACRLVLCFPDELRPARPAEAGAKVIVLTASRAAVPTINGVRAVAVTCLQDLLLGLSGIREDTPWAEWGAAPVGAAMLRRQLKARKGSRRVRLVREGKVLSVEETRRRA